MRPWAGCSGSLAQWPLASARQAQGRRNARARTTTRACERSSGRLSRSVPSPEHAADTATDVLCSAPAASHARPWLVPDACSRSPSLGPDYCCAMHLGSSCSACPSTSSHVVIWLWADAELGSGAAVGAADYLDDNALAGALAAGPTSSGRIVALGRTRARFPTQLTSGLGMLNCAAGEMRNVTSRVLSSTGDSSRKVFRAVGFWISGLRESCRGGFTVLQTWGKDAGIRAQAQNPTRDY